MIELIVSMGCLIWSLIILGVLAKMANEGGSKHYPILIIHLLSTCGIIFWVVTTYRSI